MPVKIFYRRTLYSLHNETNQCLLEARVYKYGAHKSTRV